MISLNGVPQTSMDLVRQILVNQMELDPDSVNIYDEKWIIPSTEGLFIVIEYRNGRCIGNRNTFVSDGGTPVEVQDVNMMEQLTIGVFSRNREATQRKEEVLMAILSSYAQTIQERYAFKIQRIGEIEDLSQVEGAAMLKRYDINLWVQAWYEKTIVPGYIDALTLKVIADVGNTTMEQTVVQTLTQFN